MKEIDWEKIKNPGGIFKLFCEDTKDPIVFHKKWIDFKKMLKTKYLYLSDEYRKEGVVDNLMLMFFQGVFYEIGDFQGIVGFTNIINEHKCTVAFKIWDKKIFGASFVKECKRLLDIYFDEFQLKRMSSSSPDMSMVKLAKIAGFKVEGKEPYAFKWNGKLFPNYLLGKVKENLKFVVKDQKSTGSI